jgi:hypothetical protein
LASLVEIANAALDMVGQAQILSLEDPTAAARKANLHIRDAIREVLGSGLWTSARKSAVLSQLSSQDGPTFDWLYGYQLPNDFITAVAVNRYDPDSIADTYEVNGHALYTDEELVNFVYICDLTANGNDVAAASPLLTELFKIQLAVKLSWAFQQSRTHRESLLIEYREKRSKALARDAQQSRRKQVSQLSDSNWMRYRHGSTNG